MAVLALLAGCFKTYDALSPVSFTELRYDHPILRHEDVRLRYVDLDLACPDERPARVYTVYQGDTTEPAPAAIVLHDGAFDYVITPDYDGSLLSGEHFQAVSRLDHDWAAAMGWETLGLGPGGAAPATDSQGTLVAALIDAGFLVIVPTNCWGDLWHGEVGAQQGDVLTDGFERNGRGMARRAIELLVEPDVALDAGFEVPVVWDGRLALVGLGDGGRGVVELLLADATDGSELLGVVLDSPRDRLSPMLDDELLWKDELVGLERIFGVEPAPDLDAWSLAAVSAGGRLPARTGLVWSSLDPQVPNAMLEPSADLLAGSAWIHDRGQSVHASSNNQEEVARGVAAYLLDGTIPSL